MRHIHIMQRPAVKTRIGMPFFTPLDTIVASVDLDRRKRWAAAGPLPWPRCATAASASAWLFGEVLGWPKGEEDPFTVFFL